MRCYSCGKLSFHPLCQQCRKDFLIPHITKRKIGTLEVISLFGYKNIAPLLLTKHTPAGYRLYKYLSKMILRPFLVEFASHLDEQISLLAIDEKVGKSGYSHTALLSHYASNKKIVSSHAKLLSGNDISYSGKSLQYRLEHPREFSYTGKDNIEAILLDDIITTGTTLQQARQELLLHDVEVLFAVTIADARV